MKPRLLYTDDIPHSLWDAGKQALHLPSALRLTYEARLRGEGLFELASSASPADGPVGGMSEEDNREHFATRFSGSCARIEMAVLDPRNEISDVSDLFIKAFSGGRVSVLDIPCGAGAASATLLSCIAQLRAESRLPRQPLTVKVLGGDHSEHARRFALSTLRDLKRRLTDQAVWTEERVVPWDICDQDSTTELLHEWMQWANDCQAHFAVAANFSGFLASQGKLKEATPQIQHVLGWATKRKAPVVWIEPQTNVAKGMLLKQLLASVRKRPPRGMAPIGDDTEEIAHAECRFHHPLQNNYLVPVRLSLIRLRVLS